jgi:hypothetical protein
MQPDHQSFSTHRRYFPLFHFIAIPILTINLVVRIVFVYFHPQTKMFWWDVVFAAGLVALGFASRIMALTAQDRLIRLEETIRLQRCLPDDLRPRIGELSSGQLIALRFCCDAELPDLTRAVLTEPIHKRNDIKQRIKNWRADAGPRV